MMEMMMISTILLLVFICLRRMLDGKIPAGLQYGVWLLIAARLLLVWVPLPGSSVSVMNLIPVMEDSFQYRNPNTYKDEMGGDTKQEEAVQTNGKLSKENTMTKDAVSQNKGEQQIETNAQSDREQLLESKPSKGRSGNMAVDLLSLLYRIYGMGVVFALLCMIAQNIWFWNGLRRRRIPYEGELPVKTLPGRLYLIDHLKSPFLFGKNIYVSPEMMNDRQKLHHILVHETCHWKQGDSVWSVLRCLCLAFYWYHPLVWYGVHLSIVDAELACDEKAIRVLGDKNCLDYGETLLDLIRNQAGFLKCTCISTQMSGNKQETKVRLERIVEQRKRTKGRIVFLVVSLIALCLVTLPGNTMHRDALAGTEWERVKQEGFPCIVVDEQGNIVGTRRGELLTRVIIDYIASRDNQGLDFQNYQIQADAFSGCQNLKTLILPNQNESKFVAVIDYIDPNAFRGCPKDLVVYCDKESYVWSRLHELGVTVKEIPNNEDWELLGEDQAAIKRIREKEEAEGNDSVLTDQEMLQLYGEPFFMMTESGQVLHAICESLHMWTMRELYFPTDAHTLAGTFPQYLLLDMSITIPKNIVVVGDATFMCSQLFGITFEEGSRLQTIGNSAFLQAGFSEIPLPDGLQEIGDNAFRESQNLVEITIPESVRTIGSRCFRMCSSLERVVILNPDITLGEDIFDEEILNPDLEEDDIDLDNLDSNFIPNNKLTIVCHPGSNAEKYAREYGLQVEYLE